MNPSSIQARVFIAFVLATTHAIASSDDGGALPNGYQPRPEIVGKYALVVSVEHYWYLPTVTNALSDGDAVSAALRKSGYSFVRFLGDASTADSIVDAISEMLQQAQADTRPAVLTVFFAGHGFQSGSGNYIVPAGARSESVAGDSLPVSTITRLISPSKYTLGIVFLDACRTVKTLNDSNLHTPMTSSIAAGFQSIRGNGITVVGMAASAGFAAESVGRANPTNSPYSWALSHFLTTKSQSLDQLFDDIRGYVRQDTDELQDPEENKRAGTSRFYILPDDKEDDVQDEEWRGMLKKVNRARCLEAYVTRYPAGRYVSAVQYLLPLTIPARQSDPICIIGDN